MPSIDPEVKKEYNRKYREKQRMLKMQKKTPESPEVSEATKDSKESEPVKENPVREVILNGIAVDEDPPFVPPPPSESSEGEEMTEEEWNDFINAEVERRLLAMKAPKKEVALEISDEVQPKEPKEKPPNFFLTTMQTGVKTMGKSLLETGTMMAIPLVCQFALSYLKPSQPGLQIRQPQQPSALSSMLSKRQPQPSQSSALDSPPGFLGC